VIFRSWVFYQRGSRATHCTTRCTNVQFIFRKGFLLHGITREARTMVDCLTLPKIIQATSS
jgi:hypothetical protein